MMNADKIKNFKQTDSRWAGLSYGIFTMAEAGCGSCAIADVAGKTPDVIRSWLLENDYIFDDCGTSWRGAEAALKHFGCKGVRLSEESLYGQKGCKEFDIFKEHMSRGNPGIFIVGKSNWTKSGHFLVAAKYYPDTDEVLIYDPRGEERDGKYPWSEFDGIIKICYLAEVPE